MAADMPARVEPVDGAESVDFPWDAAGEAVAALERVASTLGEQLATRSEMDPTLSDWTGAYRTEFDRKYGPMTDAATALPEQARRYAAAIVSGAEAANQEQRVKNAMAENTLLPPLGGRR
jgi:hypothetical protein